MTESSRLLSELECATMAGVSVETIRQFRGCGLLQAVNEAGTDKFREIDITTLFYNRTKAAPSDTTAQTVSSSSPLREQIVTDFVVSTSPQENANFARGNENISQTPPEETSPSATSVNENISSQSLETESSTTEQTNTETSSSETIDQGETTFRVGPEESSARVIEMLPPQSSINVEYLIEVNKGLREQIDILRGERDWLRNRVEKLETRSEREQMLLLSESENIRKLIQQNENRAFSWLRALPWFKDTRNLQK